MPRSYARFYRLLAQFPLGEGITRDELRHTLVAQYTNGRTESLREVTDEEYKAMCEGMEDTLDLKKRMRTQRSITLKIMQQLGIDTTNWARINNFCKDPRICGKPFAMIHLDEHVELQRKLRAMLRKGGLRQRTQSQKTTTAIIYHDANNLLN